MKQLLALKNYKRRNRPSLWFISVPEKLGAEIDRAFDSFRLLESFKKAKAKVILNEMSVVLELTQLPSFLSLVVFY